MTGEIFKEVYAVRRKIAEECGYDFKRLVEHYKKLQAKHPEGLCDEVPESDPEPAPAE